MIIDADSHYIPLDIYKYVPEEFKKFLPTYTKDDNDLLKVNLNNDPNTVTENPLPADFHNKHAGFYDIPARIQDFERMKIDFQIINPQEHAMRFGYAVDSELACWMAHSYNRVALDLFNEYPKKFHGPLLLALQDIDWCLEEITWGINNGFTSVLLDTSWANGNTPYGDLLLELPRINEIFARCHDLDLLVSCHHQMHQIDYRHNPIIKRYQLADLFPSHQLMLAVSLITSGTLDTFPNLRVLISEGGMQFIKSACQYATGHTGEDCTKYFKKNFWFTIETEQSIALLNCINTFGSDRFLFATDYPHDDPGGQMKFEDSNLIKKLGLDEDTLNNICFKNAINIFKLVI